MDSTARRVTRAFDLHLFFDGDTLASYEHSRTFRRREYLLPEMRLIFAVLSDAIECLQKYCNAKGRRQQRIYRESEVWIFRGDGRAPYSFEYICELLAIDPQYLRKGLEQWRGNDQCVNWTVLLQRHALHIRRSLPETRITA